jgi:hypothetical protein
VIGGIAGVCLLLLLLLLAICLLRRRRRNRPPKGDADLPEMMSARDENGSRTKGVL